LKKISFFVASLKYGVQGLYYLHAYLLEKMLSRRNVRVKVLQVLYSSNQDPLITSKESKKAYKTSIHDTYCLYILNLLQLLQIASYSQEDVKLRAEKHLPTEDDKVFTPKLFENDIMQMVDSSEGFHKIYRKNKLHKLLDKDITKRLYQEFSKTEEYKNYILNPNCTRENHRDTLLALYKSLTKNELFNEILDDHFANWQENKSLVVGAIKKTLKQEDSNPEFYNNYLPEKETVEEYGAELLHKYLQTEKDLEVLIEPNLNNWEIDRVAVIDKILLKMALCEFLHFETIPTKVTLNEYVEISKAYSTPKSKEFINGILDKLKTILMEDGKINKVERA